MELKALYLQAVGKSKILRERLRKVIINENDDADDFLCNYLDECSIFLNKLSDKSSTTVLTTCSHRYHRICLKKMIEI